MQAKIFCCITAIALQATGLLAFLEGIKSKETNPKLKELYSNTMELIKERTQKAA